MTGAYLDVGEDTIPASTAAFRIVCLAASDQSAGTVTAHAISWMLTRAEPHCSCSDLTAISLRNLSRSDMIFCGHKVGGRGVSGT